VFIALVIVYGLAAALIWGVADFSGGNASKKTNVLIVLILSQIIGVTFVIMAALSVEEEFTSTKIGWSILAGISGVIGLILLYRGLAVGKMSFIAPISAVISTSLPVIFTFITEGIPNLMKVIGLLLAIIAIAMVSYEHSGDKTEHSLTQNFLYALSAGIGFALFFVFIDQFEEGSVYWPLAILRITSISFLLVILSITLLFTSKMKIDMSLRIVNYRLIFLAGLCDMLGNIFFTLSSQSGRLDIAASISSLYPLSTVGLARIFHNELIRPHQWLGIAIALSAVVLLTY
jgi:drug/metabolite transporter (DMT)-like permease